MIVLGDRDYRYEEDAEWPQIPDECDLGEVVDVAVDSDDNVCLFCRNPHQVVIVDSAGTLLHRWGDGLFVRPHGITIDANGVLYCVDDGGHWIGRFTRQGELRGSIGTRGIGAGRQSGDPFHLPTKVAFDAKSGEFYIADGYGNARIHKFSAAGEHLFSWGEYGTDPGQFNLPHSVCVDPDGRVLVADRENHRIQVFDQQGGFLEQWNNLHRPCGLHVDGTHVYIGQLFTQYDFTADYPNIGACVSIHDLTGTRLARLGDTHFGENPGQFIAPHGIGVDSAGTIYVAEVSRTAYGSQLDPPRMVRTFRKLRKIS